MENSFEQDQDALIEDIYTKIKDPDSGMQIAHKKLHNFSKRNCFQGTELVSWLAQNIGTHKFIAEQIGQSLMDRLIIYKVNDQHNRSEDTVFSNDSSLYRFQCLFVHAEWSEGYSRTYIDILADMTRWLHEVYDKCLKEEPDKTFDYASIIKSQEYRTFVNCSVELQMIQPSLMKQEHEVLCFFINVYNVLVFHANIERERPNVKQKAALFLRWKGSSKLGYLIGGQRYSLSDIEHGILRGNRKPVFSKSDARRAFSVREFDPRVHFLLNTSTSTVDPHTPVKMYNHQTLRMELEKSTRSFCNSDEIKILLSKNLICLPWLFRVFKTDFGKDRFEIFKWISRYLPDGQKKKDLLLLSENSQTNYVSIQWDDMEASQEPEPEAESAAADKTEDSMYDGSLTDDSDVSAANSDTEFVPDTISKTESPARSVVKDAKHKSTLMVKSPDDIKSKSAQNPPSNWQTAVVLKNFRSTSEPDPNRQVVRRQSFFISDESHRKQKAMKLTKIPSESNLEEKLLTATQNSSTTQTQDNNDSKDDAPAARTQTERAPDDLVFEVKSGNVKKMFHTFRGTRSQKKHNTDSPKKQQQTTTESNTTTTESSPSSSPSHSKKSDGEAVESPKGHTVPGASKEKKGRFRSHTTFIRSKKTASASPDTKSKIKRRETSIKQPPLNEEPSDA